VVERAFYDTVIFVLSLNRRDPDHPACVELLAIESGGVTWSIAVSAITRGEATLREYLDQLELRCAQQGVEWVEVKQEQVAEAMRRARATKAALEQAGMQSRDIKQAFAAVWAKAIVFVTRDRDFFDPKDKAGAGRRRGAAACTTCSGRSSASRRCSPPTRSGSCARSLQRGDVSPRASAPQAAPCPSMSKHIRLWVAAHLSRVNHIPPLRRHLASGCPGTSGRWVITSDRRVDHIPQRGVTSVGHVQARSVVGTHPPFGGSITSGAETSRRSDTSEHVR
jgi:hypothetical protein